MKGFISYAHEDYGDFRELRRHLKSVERTLDIAFWADDEIRGGHVWNDKIARAIAGADVFLLLCSHDFFASDYIFKTEKPAIERKCATSGLIIPVLLKPCLWKSFLQALHVVPASNGSEKAIDSWRPKQHGFHAANEQILGAIADYFGLPAGAVTA